MDGHSLTQAHYTVLQNSSLVAPYIEEHKNILRSKHPEQSDDWITHGQTGTFVGWLHTPLMHEDAVEDELLAIQVTIFEYIDFQRVRDKWKYILHDRPR